MMTRIDLSELNKLERYLKEHNIKYERLDEDDDDGYFCRHQISVPEHGAGKKWDAICQYGSYGYEAGLLEIYGTLVDRAKWGDTDTVCGWLKADDVIARIEAEEVRQDE